MVQVEEQAVLLHLDQAQKQQVQVLAATVVQDYLFPLKALANIMQVAVADQLVHKIPVVHG